MGPLDLLIEYALAYLTWALYMFLTGPLFPLLNILLSGTLSGPANFCGMDVQCWASLLIPCLR